jgi:hypothetical protein
VLAGSPSRNRASQLPRCCRLARLADLALLHAEWAAPLLSRGIDGRGQSVVLVELVPSQMYSATNSDIRDDLAVFDGLFGLPAVRLQVITRFAGARRPYLVGASPPLEEQQGSGAVTRWQRLVWAAAAGPGP